MNRDELLDFLHLTEKHLAAMRQVENVKRVAIARLEAQCADIRREIAMRFPDQGLH